MLFTSLEEAEAFYNEYAKQSGFTVRKGPQYEVSGVIKGRHFVCSKEDMYFLRSNMHLTRVQESQIYELYFANLGPIKAFNVMWTKYGGFEKVGATVVECKNFKRDLNCYFGEYVADIVVRRMLNKKDFLPDYSFEYTVDNEGKLTAMFWADGARPTIKHLERLFLLMQPSTQTSIRWFLFLSPELIIIFVMYILVLVGPVLCNDEEFKKAMCSIVWTDSIDPEFFDGEWLKLMDDNDLASNKWLREMFEMREMWIPAYFRDEWIYTFPDIWTEFAIEEQAARIYTRAMFNDVQDEIYCSTKNCFGINIVTGYNTAKVSIKDHAAIGPGLLEVDFTRIDGDITCTCSCKRFERYGLLCSHVFYVLTMFEVLEIPQKYIMKRWTKEAAPNKGKKVLPPSSDSNFSNAHEVDNLLRDIMSSYEYIINRLSPGLEALCSVRDQMKEIAKKVDEENRPVVPKNRRDRFAKILRANQPINGSKKLPDGIKNKGRGSHKRIKSKKEQTSSCAGKRSRKCLVCGLTGHDRRTRKGKKVGSDDGDDEQ
ncbi:hypothetical protein SSX86_008178 [Deinandra increscens subsp. villosa]|uniref:SWIM-type domain-containing protein n=1 Tax=Deinandra increscens subsp. villosa TaxID=3103831 RepID=A0AAP0DB75_9ASTR